MPLSEAILKADILKAFNDESDQDVDPAQARERQAAAIAAAIMKQFHLAKVTSAVTGATAIGSIT